MFAAVLTAAVAGEALNDVAREFSPRIEIHGGREVTLDVAGLSRLFESSRALGEELRRAAADRDLQVRVAVASTRTAARLLVRARPGLTVIDEAGRLAALAALPVETLASLMENDASDAVGRRSWAGRESPQVVFATDGLRRPAINDQRPTARITDMVATLHRWGIRTLGELAALPPAALSERLGQEGITWQRLGRGEDAAPLVPAAPEERFEASFDLEWPIETLEPLSFVIGRLLDDLCGQLASRHRAAMAVGVDLHLVTRDLHARRLELPQPMRDARALRTVALLDLESHPAPAAIDRVTVRLEPAPARPLQHALFTRPEPAPEQIATLLARLSAVMGEGRVGSPATVDAWRPGAFAMRPFRPSRMADCGLRIADLKLRDADCGMGIGEPSIRNPQSAIRNSLRRFRLPVPARVNLQGQRPVRVATDRRGVATGRIIACAGPWRTSGCWWTVGDLAVGSGWSAHDEKREPPRLAGARSGQARNQKRGAGPWDRDEWDVALSDGGVYRLFRDRESDGWFVEGTYD